MDIFVRRPVIAVVIALVLLLSGIFAATRISILQFPQINSASLLISTHYSGSSADVIQGFITDPIERVAMTIPGVDYVDSITTAGMSTVTVWLNLNEDITVALAELSSQLNQIRNELPVGAEDPAVTVQRADRSGAAFYLNTTASGYSRAEITDYLKRNVNPLLAGIEGVQRIELHGGRDPAMRIWLDPDRLASLGLAADDVWTALNANNVIATFGKTDNAAQQINLLSNASLKTPEQFAQLIIKQGPDGMIRLADVARVELAEDAGTETTRTDNQQGVFIAVWPKPGANEIVIGDALYPLLTKINASLPTSMALSMAYDSTTYMRAALIEIGTTLAETVLLVGLVVLIMMGSLRMALVPLVTIPISLLGAIGVIWALGFSLNLLTILAIVLAVGLVVDDAIVVVENVARHMREGKSRLQAALISSRELLKPIIAMTLTLAAVYTPIGFVDGLTGALFREFAFTLAIAVLISGVVAITLSPIMSAWISADKGKEARATLIVNRYFEKMRRVYTRLLTRLFEWRPQVLFGTLMLTLLIVPFYMFSDKEFAPPEDQGSIMLLMEGPADSSIDYTIDYATQMVDSLDTLEGKTLIWQILNPSAGFGGISFVDYSERSQSVQQILPDLYYGLSQIDGLRVMPILMPALPTAGQFDVEMVIQGPDDYDTLANYAQQLVNAAYSSGLFMFVNTDLQISLPQAHLLFDLDRMADLGLTMASVNSQLSAMNSEQYVNRFDANGKAYRVITQLENASRTAPEAMLDVTLFTATGNAVPLRAIATLDTEVSPRAMGKFNQQRSFRVLGGIVPGVTADMALSALEKSAAELLPASYTVDYAGMSRQLRREGNDMMSVLMIALVMVYLLLTVQFNSFRSPLVVLLGSVPLALSGALVFAFLGLTTINIYAQIGFITLVALVAKNGILITEFANELQLQGMNKLTAIHQSAQLRLRPILMTTLATVLGHFPLILVTGAGAQARNSIGIILVAGMAIGTVFTLFVLPVIYLWLGEDLSRTNHEKTAIKSTDITPSLPQ